MRKLLAVAAAVGALWAGPAAAADTIILDFESANGSVVSVFGRPTWFDHNTNWFASSLPGHPDVTFDDGEMTVAAGGTTTIYGASALFLRGFFTNSTADFRVFSTQTLEEVTATPNDDGFVRIPYLFAKATLNSATHIRTVDGTAFTVDDVSAAAVPEPKAWGLMILGFSGLGVALRRRPARAA